MVYRFYIQPLYLLTLIKRESFFAKKSLIQRYRNSGVLSMKKYGSEMPCETVPERLLCWHEAKFILFITNDGVALPLKWPDSSADRAPGPLAAGCENLCCLAVCCLCRVNTWHCQHLKLHRYHLHCFPLCHFLRVSCHMP